MAAGVDVDTVEEIQQFMVAGKLDLDAVDHWSSPPGARGLLLIRIHAAAWSLQVRRQIGRAHVRTPVTPENLVCRLLLALLNASYAEVKPARPQLWAPPSSGTFVRLDRKSTRLNSSHSGESRMPSSA